MDLKDFDYVNECVNFLNGFSAKQIKVLTTDMIVTKELVDEYKKAVEMTLNSKKSLPDYPEHEKRAANANIFLDKLLKYKKVSRIPR